PTVDVPDHAHYVIGSVILLVGVTGTLGNALVIYVFCRSRALRSPSNLLVVNLAVADFLMSLTQSPVFFVASLHRHWPFGELACELYAFCGALFGIASMMTLTAIAVDRCLAVTRPLARLGGVSPGRVRLVLAGVWLYSLCWSLPPFFGWSAYVPEGLQTSCSWDYMSFSAAVRSYTVLLFTFVFFVPLGLIAGCYWAIFRAVRRAGREVARLSCAEENKAYERLRSEVAPGQSGARGHSALHRLLVSLLRSGSDRHRWPRPPADALHELHSCRHRQGFGHPQPHHLRHHTPQIPGRHRPPRPAAASSAAPAGQGPSLVPQLPAAGRSSRAPGVQPASRCP
ncbi:unnamed protein product, partial [Tetraodon nigroviridis]